MKQALLTIIIVVVLYVIWKATFGQKIDNNIYGQNGNVIGYINDKGIATYYPK